MTTDRNVPQESARRFSPLLVVAAALILVLLFTWMLIPNFVRSGPRRFIGIINTLRQIDGAKQQWAYEHGITNAVLCTNMPAEADVLAYLSSGKDEINRFGFGFDRNGRPQSGVGEKYILNPLSLSPEAQLTRDFKEGRGSTFALPKDTIIRLSGSGYEIVLPDGSKLSR